MKSLLIVEDRKKLAGEVGDYFTKKNYSISIANDKTQALVLLKKKHFDGIFLDLHIPVKLGKDKALEKVGISLLKKIKEDYSKTCVVVITIEGSLEKAVEPLRAGVYDYIPKPFKLSVLEQTIKKGIAYQSLKNKFEAEKKKQDEYILRLAHGLIHMVKNSLWLISGNSQLLAESNLSSEGKRLIEIIQTHADKSNKVLDEFLFFRRKFKDGKELGEKKSTKVEDLIDSAVSLVKSFPWKNKRIEIKKGKIEEGLPEINANRFLLQEVLINIIKNGVEAIGEDEPGKVEIDVESGANGFIEINVNDNGMGIYEGDLEKVKDCEPYFTTKEYGTGLGLCTSEQILKEHKGGIFINSEWGKGTKVSITLPIIKENIV